MIVGGHVEGGQTTRTRPICAYPTVARYKGSGSIDAAENFNCVAQ
jgi:feruloyl esterase